MIFLLILLMFSVILSLKTNSLSLSSKEPFNASIIYTSPSAVLNNSIFYLCAIINGTVSLNLVSQSATFNVTSVSTYLSGLNIPILQLDGFVISTPKVIGNKVFFIYLPGVKSINPSNLTIKKSYFAYASFNGNWGKVINLLTYGASEDFDVYNNTVYLIWKPSYSSSNSFLLILNSNGILLNNISLNIINATSISVSNGLGVIGNSSISQLTSLENLSVSGLVGDYFVINLSNGKVLYEIPEYNGLEPSLVSVSDNLALVTYSSSSASYLVLYNLSNQKILSTREYNSEAIGYINDGYILVEQIVKSNFGINSIITVYNENWSVIYQKSQQSLTSYLLADGLIVNSTSVTAIITTINTELSFSQITIISSIELIKVLEAPEPFTISVYEYHYPGYTILYLIWNEKVPSTFYVYFNNSLRSILHQNYVEYNITQNVTYLVKIVAMNALGNITENIIIKIIVYPYLSKITSTTTTSSSSTTSTTETTVSNITTQQTTENYYTTTESSNISHNITTISHLSTTSVINVPQTEIVAIILIVIGTVILILLSGRKLI